MVANQACFSRKPAFNHRRSICWSMGMCVKQPFMADSIKASLDVPFQNPLWTVPVAQDNVRLFQSIGAAAFQSKAIGMAVGLRFRDGIKTEQVQCLHGSIRHGGNP